MLINYCDLINYNLYFIQVSIGIKFVIHPENPQCLVGWSRQHLSGIIMAAHIKITVFLELV